MAELDNNAIVQRKHSIKLQKLYDFIKDSFATYIAIGDQFKITLVDLNTSFGPPGEPGNALQIKNAVERMMQICRELLAWEYELYSFNLPNELIPIKTVLKGYSKTYIDVVNTLPQQIEEFIKTHIDTGKGKQITFDIKLYDGVSKASEMFLHYVTTNGITDIEP